MDELATLPENLKEHPCWRGRLDRLSHRFGGFGGTCERCGTPLVEGDANNTAAGPVCWEPVQPPQPFQPGSMERVIYDTMRATGAPISFNWCEEMTRKVAAALTARAALSKAGVK